MSIAFVLLVGALVLFLLALETSPRAQRRLRWLDSDASAPWRVAPLGALGVAAAVAGHLWLGVLVWLFAALHAWMDGRSRRRRGPVPGDISNAR